MTSKRIGPNRRVFLGIDCGTQSTKALLLCAEDGTVMAVGRGQHRMIESADGTREQDPAWWVSALQTAVAEVRTHVGEIEIAGIGVSGQQHGLVCLDDLDRPVRPAKLWNDTTTTAECDDLTERLGGAAAVLAETGNLFLPGYTAPKIAWLRRNERESYEKTSRFCLPHDYLNLWLTGEFCTEPGDASGTGYFDVRKRRYSEPVLKAIDPSREWSKCVPPPVPSLSLIGRLRPSAAEALGLPSGIPVSAGGGDNMCAAIGAGAVEPGPVVVSIGTSGTVFAYSSEPAIDPEGEAAAFCSSTGGWLPLACTLNGTSATEWVRGVLGLDLHGLEQAVISSVPGARGLTFIPYMNGERTPNRPSATGVLVGLRTHHDASDVARAVLEGVTFGLDYAMQALGRAGIMPTAVTLVGGGASSDAWAQICADIFVVPVVRPRLNEAAALGAACQVRHVVDGAPLPAAEPDGDGLQPVSHAGLEQARDRFERIRDAAADVLSTQTRYS